jgi:RecQ family ATP-dependent DNA helicase
MCYQLPALLFDGLTVVVSPLIALMQDQVDALLATGVRAAYLNSTVDYHSYVETANRVRAGALKLLYMAPETLLRPETLVMLDKSNVECLTIDEAHCISSWGHDFRPEYRQLLALRKRYPKAVCLALTATATRRVQDDIRAVLGFGASNTFVASFNRPNLFLKAQQRKTRLPQVMDFLATHPDESGIIYTNRRKDAEALADQLTQLGRPALPYHAGMPDGLRREHQRRFTRDEAQIIVATIAFGMGINKSNVRFILHTALPENLENYYQQIGRAGRDGLRADCLLLWSYVDLKIIRKFIQESAPEEQPGKEARLQAMLRYAEAEGCRRTPLLAYFGETLKGNCATCDNCVGEEPARKEERREAPARSRSSAPAPAAVPTALDMQHERALFEELRGVRLALAREARVPPFVVFSDRTLQEMAQKRPLNEDALLQVGGVGAHKLATYGTPFLEAIRAYCEGHGLAHAAPPPVSPARALSESERSAEIGLFFNSGLSVDDLERLYGVQRATIVRNLVTHHAEGHPLDRERVLAAVRATEEQRADAFALFAEAGAAELRPVFDALGGKVSYDDLRLLRLYFLSQDGPARGPQQHETGRQDAT